ncbi:MAG: hypothetical protein M1820_000908 [Bogoriella megaspora]|nr:MAG: hypothetical protein M1820_000908 [Bogoriella megaspora]
MLFDFYQKQSGSKSGSVHATYIVKGTRRLPEAPKSNGFQSQDGDDSIMYSDNYMSSSAPEPDGEDVQDKTQISSIVIVREEHLEELKSQYDAIDSIHIYSLEPGVIKDLHILTDCNREVNSKYGNEDPMQIWRQYGTIQNQNVKRRTMQNRQPVAAPIAPVSAPKHTVEATAQRTNKRPLSPGAKDVGFKPKDEGKERSPETNAPTRTELVVSSKPDQNRKTAAPKKQNSTSALFRSFEKAKPKKQPNGSPAAQTPTQEDQPMFEDDDDEGPEEDFQIQISTKEEREARAKAKRDKEEALKRMMEDTEMSDPPAQEEATQEDEEMQDSQPIDRPPSRDSAAAKEENATVSGGRKRGKRKVMKKKTTKDEDGYLVTKEEAVWESFSEDEPEPKKSRLPPVTAAPAKGKKGGKPGQGNIMNFFGKK